MSKLWLRKVRLTIEGKAGKLVVDERMKIDFEVTASIGSSQNSGSVTVWNLTKSHRAQLGEEFDTLTLEAGYTDGPFGVILKGDIRDVENKLADGAADISSVITVGDGDKAVNKGAASKTFPSGTKPKDIMAYLAGQMPGAKLGSTVGIDELPKTKRPVTVFGHSAKEMDKLGRAHGFYWSIQKGQIEAVKNDRFIDQRVKLDPKTGLIGTPTVTDKGLSFKCLLHPDLAPNRVAEVSSPFLDESGKSGAVRLSSVKFSGSSQSVEFYAECEGNRIEGKKVTK